MLIENILKSLKFIPIVILFFLPQLMVQTVESGAKQLYRIPNM